MMASEGYNYGTSPSEVFLGDILKIYSKFTGEHQC